MKSIGKILFVFLFLFLNNIYGQNKPEFSTYSVETTFQKLHKNYPFISPVSTLESDLYLAHENLTYKSIGDRELKLDVYVPTVNNGKNFTAVLLIHGGGWASGSKENQRVMAQHLAVNGYVGIPVSYRLSEEAPYPAGVIDLKDAIRWIRQNGPEYSINPDQIAVLGTSAGAQLATLIGTTADLNIFKPSNSTVSDKVQAILNIDGIVSFVHSEAEEGDYAAFWLGGNKTDAFKTWKEASPLEYVGKDTPPTLFLNSDQPRFHAGRDDMINLLNQYNTYNEIHTIPDSPHSFWLLHPWFEPTVTISVDFLNRVFQPSNHPLLKPYREITVSKDGEGDYSTIQEAINSTRDLGPAEVKIHIKNGVYQEKIEIPTWKHKLTLIGEDRESTIISNNDFSGKIDSKTGLNMSTFTSYTLLVRGDDIKIENLTIRNSSCGEGQAVALHVEGDRFIIKNSNLIGCQDTLYTATEGSRQYYENCYIEGTTDFIFGEATAVFKDCVIHSKVNSFVTAAATPANQDFGYVFFNCKLKAGEGVNKVYLGRPWRPYAKTVFINCELGSHILAPGWDPWTGDKMFPEKEKTTYYAEYNSVGPGASINTRVAWSHQLNKEEVKTYNLINIFKKENSWFPNKSE
ncbi:pectinesterase family protein [Aegicerativicinus sediminis]|uniref:pectinesterase family protein n=1 Tax=Aegicerativicinus sediminis TaxID=2893202 RepID=UPI001E5CA64A|nr:pectinesterase family protein [Aegicerativicinus sediminis]